MRRQHALESSILRRRRERVAVVGLGPIGVEVAKLLLRRADVFRCVAAVDRAAHLAGKPLRRVLGAAAPAGRILAGVEDLPSGGGIALHTTSSHLKDVAASIETLLASGWHVVSSTEELSYPWLRQPRLARRIDAAARRAGRAVVGTGINPGFAMDVWPLVLSSNAQTLDGIQVHRVVDASLRREPLQRKIGSGMTRREFEALAEEGRIGHVGLVESAAHLAGALGWAVTSIHELLEPRIAAKKLSTRFFEVPAGRVCGIHHRAEAFEKRRRRIVLDLVMSLDARDARDEIELDGEPAMRCIVPGGFHGDRTTASQLVAAAARIGDAPPGLHLASDLSAPRWAALPQRLHLG